MNQKAALRIAIPSAPPQKQFSKRDHLDVQSLSLVLARKVAFACFPEKTGAIMLYRVPRGWVTAVLRDDPQVRLVETTYELNDFFHSRGTEIALVPADFPADFQTIMRMCGYCGVDKTLFLEVDEQ